MLAKANMHFNNSKIPVLSLHKSDPFYSEENLKRLKESIKELEEGKVVTKSLKELKKNESSMSNDRLFEWNC